LQRFGKENPGRKPFLMVLGQVIHRIFTLNAFISESFVVLIFILYYIITLGYCQGSCGVRGGEDEIPAPRI